MPKKFQFPLEHVLEHRKRLELAALVELNEKRAELQEARNVLMTYNDQVKSARDLSFRTERKGGQSFVTSTQVYDFEIGQKKKISLQESKIRGLESEVEKLQDILRLKKTESTMIEKLKEKKLSEFKKQERHREAKELDDMVMVRSLRSATKT